MCGFNMQRLPIRDQDIISELIIIIINTIICSLILVKSMFGLRDLLTGILNL
jgi:hypothetical protein